MKIIAALGLFGASPAESQTAGRPTAVDPLAMDVAGVRLGMTPEAARSALQRSGYRLAGGDDAGLSRGPSFASQVRQAAERRRTGTYVAASMADRVFVAITAIGPNRERLTVYLDALPTGSSAVREVELHAPAEMVTGPAFLRQAVARYGRPDGVVDGGLTQLWCSASVRAICGSVASARPSPRSLPNLLAQSILEKRTIRLSEGTDAARRRERDLAAAIDRAAPPVGRAAF